MSAVIPASYRDLLEGPYVVTIGTLMPDGRPQLTAMWCTVEGDEVLFSTTKGRQKYRNLTRDPRATLLAFAPDNPYRTIEIRGTVEVSEEGGVELINRLAKLYRGKDEYYGGVAPASLRDQEVRVVCRLRPQRVITRG